MTHFENGDICIIFGVNNNLGELMVIDEGVDVLTRENKYAVITQEGEMFFIPGKYLKKISTIEERLGEEFSDDA